MRRSHTAASRRGRTSSHIRPVATPEFLESRLLLCADHAIGMEPAAAALPGSPIFSTAHASPATKTSSTAKPVMGPLLPADAAAFDAAALAAQDDVGGNGNTTVPSGFTEQQLATGMTSPTALEVAPDGRIFVSEQTGAVRVVKNGVLLPDPFVTVTEDSYFERGLFGVAFDPNYATNRFVYVYYTALLPGRAPGATDNPQRVSRFTADPANPDRALAGSEVILYETGGIGTAMWHSGGAIDFGPDGKLYVAIGEAQQPSMSQSLNSPLGKILRINPDGSIPTDNPFYNQTTGINRAIWAMGLRNPFTAAFQPGTGRYYINDVGQDAWEEINEGFAGANFGWPGTEGAFNPNQFLNLTNPEYAYPHSEGCSISGGAFYNPTNNVFPAQYTGKYFFGDFCGGWIRTLDPETGQVGNFATGVQSNVGITVGNDGALYYISRGSGFGGTPNTGSLYRIGYAVGAAPTISQQPQDVLASVGENATFAVQATGTGPFSYQWQRAAGPGGTFANIAGATGATYTRTNVNTADNDSRYRVIVTGAGGPTTSNAAILTVTTNRRPTAVITTPTAGTTYGGGQTINFAGGGFDLDEGNLPASGLTWRVDFHHADHVHPYLPDSTGSSSGSFVVPTEAHGASNVYYRITLTVRDAGGLTRSIFRDVHPRLSNVTVTADQPGLRVLVGAQPRTVPHAFEGIEGVHYDIEAPQTQFANGLVYEFVEWSDGGAQAHALVTPVDDVTVTARYRVVESAGFAIEGESTSVFSAPMAKGSLAGASGGQYIGSPSANADTVDNADTAGGRATYTFSVPADGAYAIWARGMAPTDTDDSFWFRIDAQPWWLWDMPNNGSNWTWDQVGNRQPGGGPAPASATLAQLTAGAHTITIRVREDGARVDQFLVTRDTAFVPGTSQTFDPTPPRVEQVYVAGSTWSTSFLNQLGGIGYALPAGSTTAQLDELPWTNINQIKVKFTEAMSTPSLEAAAASVLGMRTANYAMTYSGYDAATRVATWTLAEGAVFNADRVRLVLPQTITDAGGTALDGNWTTGQSFNSGNGIAGGDLDFAFNVLPGDVNRSGGSVNAGDVTQVRNRQFTDTANPGTAPNLYTVFHDVNGNGVINAQDVTLTRNRQFTDLPEAPNLAASLESLVRRDAEDDDQR